jgi:hypothetical protein
VRHSGCPYAASGESADPVATTRPPALWPERQRHRPSHAVESSTPRSLGPVAEAEFDVRAAVRAERPQRLVPYLLVARPDRTLAALAPLRGCGRFVMPGPSCVRVTDSRLHFRLDLVARLALGLGVVGDGGLGVAGEVAPGTPGSLVPSRCRRCRCRRGRRRTPPRTAGRTRWRRHAEGKGPEVCAPPEREGQLLHLRGPPNAAPAATPHTAAMPTRGASQATETTVTAHSTPASSRTPARRDREAGSHWLPGIAQNWGFTGCPSERLWSILACRSPCRLMSPTQHTTSPYSSDADETGDASADSAFAHRMRSHRVVRDFAFGRRITNAETVIY